MHDQRKTRYADYENRMAEMHFKCEEERNKKSTKGKHTCTFGALPTQNAVDTRVEFIYLFFPEIRFTCTHTFLFSLIYLLTC